MATANACLRGLWIFGSVIPEGPVSASSGDCSAKGADCLVKQRDLPACELMGGDHISQDWNQYLTTPAGW